MVLTKDNCGKYLTGEFARLFEIGVRDRTMLSADEIAWVELPSDLGNGKEDPETFKIQSQPIDTHTEATKTIDIRHRPGMDEGD